MANEVKLTLRVDDNGSLAIVAKEAKDASAATEKLDKSTNKLNKSRSHYNKVEKGVGQAGLSSGKAFSKQTGIISGGLVPAYAILAANVFAVTAAFGALQRAAQVEQLTQGLTQLGAASGLAMQQLSQGLREATGNALSLEEAMRSTALITSAGLDPSSIQRFGEVARNASVALGRDTADSLNRLSRGVTKLEPELLDELGIMVRLDEATENYAAKLGKSAGELTNFEKRQAFMNAVLEEGEKKFGAIGEEVDTNPYDKLAATFQDLSKSTLGFINTALKPLVTFLAQSPTALFGVLLAFGSGVITKMIPALGDMKKSIEEGAEATMALSDEQLKNLVGLKGTSKAVQEHAKAVAEGEVSIAKEESAIRGANSAYTKRSNVLKKLLPSGKGVLKTTKAFVQSSKEEKQAIFDQIKVVRAAAKAKDIYAKRTFLAEKATLDLEKATIVHTMTNVDFIQGAKEAGENLKKQALNMKAGIANSTALGMANIFLTGTFGLAATAAEFLGVAINKIAPIITIISIAFAVLAPLVNFIMGLFTSPATERYNKELDSLNSTLDELKVNSQELNAAFTGTSSKIVTATQKFEAYNNVLNQFSDGYKKVAAAAKETGDTDGQVEAIDRLIGMNDQLREAFAQEFDGAKSVEDLAFFQSESLVIAEKFIEKQVESVKAMNNFAQSIKSTKEVFTEFFNSMKVTTPLDNIAAAVKDIEAEMVKAEKTGKSLGGIFADMSGDQAALFGISDEVKIFQNLGASVSDANKALEEAENRTPWWAKLYDNSEIRILKASAEDAAARQEVLEGQLTGRVQERVKEVKTLVLEAQRELQVAKENQAAQKSRLALIQESRNISGERMKDEVAAQNKLTNLEIDSLTTQKDLKTQLLAKVKGTEQEKAVQAEIDRITADILLKREELTDKQELAVKTAEAEIKALQEQQKAARAVLDIFNRQASASKDAIKNEETRLRLAKEQENRSDPARSTGSKLLAEDELEIQLTLKQSRLDLIDLEEKSKLKQLALDKAMLNLTLKKTLHEMKLYQSKRTGTDPDMSKDITELESLMADINGTNGLFAQLEQNVTDAATNQRTELEQNLSLMNQQIMAAQSQINEQNKLTELESKRVQEAKKLAKSQKQALDIQIQADKLSNTRIDGGVKSAVEAARIEATSRNNKLKAARVEHDLLKAGIEAENALLIAKFNLTVLEMAKDELTAQEQSLISASAQVLTLQIQASKQTLKNSEQKLKNTEEELRIENQKAIVAAGGKSGAISAINAFQGTMVANAATAGADPESAKEQEKAQNRAEAQRALTRGILEGVAEDMKKLGPEGEVVAATISGALAISDAFTSAFETIKASGGDMAVNISAGLQAVSATIGAISQIQQAQARAGVAAIDKQIEAEQKRDGASSKSMAKIQALEKKKDDMKRKAFEQDKKAKIAQAVASTAAGMIGVFAGVKDPLFSMPLAIAQAAVIAAAGAASIAAISSTSYNGGGASAPKGPPKSVGVGSRSNQVDVGQRARGGELAYLRGQRGRGTNANDFTPAFYGSKKMRAVGGSVAGYTVGEQGPELFVPSVPGQIVPNDETGQAQAINVNFNVQAIDSSSFNDALTVQRGNIISMIREAANGSGEGFLETVDVESLKMEK